MEKGSYSQVAIILGGLPASGKTSVAQAFAERNNFLFLRIDTIEQQLKLSGCLNMGAEGYIMAIEIAKDNLNLGNSVIIDSVNPIELTREMYRKLAHIPGTKLIEAQFICSDMEEHKDRVENRESDIADFSLPTWGDVENREYHEWKDCDFTIDTAGKSLQQSVNEFKSKIDLCN